MVNIETTAFEITGGEVKAPPPPPPHSIKGLNYHGSYRVKLSLVLEST